MYGWLWEGEKWTLKMLYVYVYACAYMYICVVVMRPHIYKYMDMRTYISIAFFKFNFLPPHSQPYTFYHRFYSLLKISQLYHRSQMPSSHTSTTKEPLHNNIPAAATGYNLKRTHGHNSGPLWHPATRPNNAGTPSLPGPPLAYQ